MPRINVRDAGTWSEDADFIIAAFDSTLPPLATKGNGGQWGTTPFSEREGFCQATRDDVRQSEVFRKTGLGERLRIFIAEVEVEDGELEDDQDVDDENGPSKRLPRRVDEQGRTFLPVGTVTLRDEDFASHVFTTDALVTHVTKAREEGGFVFLDVLVTDYRTGLKRKGAGAALIQRVMKYARDQGKKAIYIDCWAGGTGKLVTYYKQAGFESVQEFGMQRKDGSFWSGRFFRMSI